MEDQTYSETLFELWLKQHKDKQAFSYNPESQFLYYNLIVGINFHLKHIDLIPNQERESGYVYQIFTDLL